MSCHFKWCMLLFLAYVTSRAGVINPGISVIGQVYGTYTDDSASRAAHKFPLSLGETELQLDAPLNPYLNGMFVLSIDSAGIDVEEAYATLIRGLPYNIALKAGKYRLNFGKLNASHPHAYPFLRTPRVLDPTIAQLLPGEESFNDVAAEASTLIPVIGSWTATLSGDFLEGNSYHPDTGAISQGWLAHLSNAFILDPASLDIGFSATQGINNVHLNTKTTLVGADAKAKIVVSPLATVTIAGEGLYKKAKIVNIQGAIVDDDRYGIYAYANVQFLTRYNGGILLEQYQDPANSGNTDRAIKPFVGFSVLEESTILRLSYELFAPGGGGKQNNTVEMQLLFSMGPHKAHQF